MPQFGTKNLNYAVLHPLFLEKEKYPKGSVERSEYVSKIMTLVCAQLRNEFAYFPLQWRSKHFIDYGDATSLVFDGLFKAIDLYNPNNKGSCKFSSYLWTIVGQRFKINDTYWNATKRNSKCVLSLDGLTTDDAPWHEWLTLTDNSEKENEFKLNLSVLKKKLPPEDYSLLLGFLHGYTPRELSTQYGLSVRKIKNLLSSLPTCFESIYTEKK